MPWNRDAYPHISIPAKLSLDAYPSAPQAFASVAGMCGTGIGYVKMRHGPCPQGTYYLGTVFGTHYITFKVIAMVACDRSDLFS